VSICVVVWSLGCGMSGRGKTHFSDTAASRSAMLLSILNRSFRAREKERAMVLREAVNVCSDGVYGCCNIRLRPVAGGLPVAVKLFVGHSGIFRRNRGGNR